jgi:hypothetical protein
LLKNSDEEGVSVEISGVYVEGVPLIGCIFCRGFVTCCEFDLENHLYLEHKNFDELLGLGRGPIEQKIQEAINQGRALQLSSSSFTKVKTQTKAPEPTERELKGIWSELSERDKHTQADYISRKIL